ncbi:hypothetical protein [Haladaptatus sp. CMAA 1911]|uniref:hypothetical protein n=1 Tax=unclassified Haladaptatus TaxID=2622732 RepID=UPI0037550BAC
MVEINTILLTMLEVTVLIVTALLIVTELSFDFYERQENNDTMVFISLALLLFGISGVCAASYLAIRLFHQLPFWTAVWMMAAIVPFAFGMLIFLFSMFQFTTDFDNRTGVMEP